MYALKIRHLLTPSPGHWFPPFRAWHARDVGADFPNETENVGSRLGLVATAGFLGLMVVLIVPALAGSGESGETIRGTSRLVIGAIILATVVLTGERVQRGWPLSPVGAAACDITPFIAFFSLVSVAPADSIAGRLAASGCAA